MVKALNENIKEIPEFLKPKLLLFLSVDIVGSTAYKQYSGADQSLSHTQTWVEMVTSFYQNFHEKFLTELNKVQIHFKKYIPDWRPLPEPVLWKAAGDELIYCVRLENVSHVLLFVQAWLNAVEEVRKILITFSNKLSLKSCGWLAGFPVNNTEVIIGLGDSQKRASSLINTAGSHVSEPYQINMLNLWKYYNDQLGERKSRNVENVDYIGPSLDIGFRLSSHATPRRFILSVDLAYLVAEAVDTITRNHNQKILNWDDEKNFFHISPPQILKGVLDGMPYPIIWIDAGVHKEYYKWEDKILKKSAVSKDEVKDYCEKFINAIQVPYLFLPFISSVDGDGGFPSAYGDKYAKLIDKWENVKRDHEEIIKLNNNPSSIKKVTPKQLKGVEKFVKDLNSQAIR